MAAEGLSRLTYLVVDRSTVGGVTVKDAVLLTGEKTTEMAEGNARSVT